MTKPADDKPPDEPSQPIISSLLQTTSVPLEAETMQAIADELVSLSEELQATQQPVGVDVSLLMEIEFHPALAVIEEDVTDDLDAEETNWEAETPAEPLLMMEPIALDPVPLADSAPLEDPVEIEAPSLPTTSVAPVVAVIPPPDDNRAMDVVVPPHSRSLVAQPRRTYFRIVVPLLWASVCWIHFHRPGDEYGLWGVSSMAGLWLPILIPVSTSVNVILWWVLVVGTAVMTAVGFALDRLRASMRLWLVLTAALTAFLSWQLLWSYDTWAAAISKNGSIWAYVLSSLNLAHTVTCGILLLGTAAYRVFERYVKRGRASDDSET